MSEAPADWDFARQEQETAMVCLDLVSKGVIAPGDAITLDLHFVAAGPGADRAGFVAAMQAAGYSGTAYTDPEGQETIEASLPGLAFGAAAIWAEEERASRIAIAFGYLPDGWGFAEP
ncbi:MAG: hypothetical protein AAFQ88_09695 [Pseudomonadota bacterium]